MSRCTDSTNSKYRSTGTLREESKDGQRHLETLEHAVVCTSYLVDPASSICLSQRLSHACLSINDLYCETANGSLYQL